MKSFCTKILSPLLSNARNFFSKTNTNDRVLETLSHRSLLKLQGPDTVNLLQGLVTNDVLTLANNGVGSLYALFLNIKGRVLFDTIIYKIPESDTYLLEVDKAASSSVQKHINVYRVRKNVRIENVDHEYKLWTHFDPTLLTLNPKDDLINYQNAIKDNLSSDSAIVLETNNGKVMEFFDPRTPLLGSRIIAHRSSTDIVHSHFGMENLKELYKMYRYRLGIAEGLLELPSGRCIPLEANCDYLNGISFDKGCYLGQELTARSYFTGVIRKRYMPVYFQEQCDDEILDETITAFDKKVGVLRGRKNNLGLGLLRIADVENKSLIADGMKAYTIKPFWWPSGKKGQAEDLVVNQSITFVTKKNTTNFVTNRAQLHKDKYS